MDNKSSQFMTLMIVSRSGAGSQEKHTKCTLMVPLDGFWTFQWLVPYWKHCLDPTKHSGYCWIKYSFEFNENFSVSIKDFLNSVSGFFGFFGGSYFFFVKDSSLGLRRGSFGFFKVSFGFSKAFFSLVKDFFGLPRGSSCCAKASFGSAKDRFGYAKDTSGYVRDSSGSADGSFGSAKTPMFIRSCASTPLGNTRGIQWKWNRFPGKIQEDNYIYSERFLEELAHLWRKSASMNEVVPPLGRHVV